VSVSSCSRFLVAGFHPRGRSAFAVFHDLDDLTFLVPSGVFQPVTLMGFGYPSEYSRGSRQFLRPRPPEPTVPHQRFHRYPIREPPRRFHVRMVPASRGVSTSSLARSFPTSPALSQLLSQPTRPESLTGGWDSRVPFASRSSRETVTVPTQPPRVAPAHHAEAGDSPSCDNGLWKHRLHYRGIALPRDLNRIRRSAIAGCGFAGYVFTDFVSPVRSPSSKT
jgi:hypothetical protein